MEEQPSLSDLLLLLLGMPETSAIHATPSFHDWLRVSSVGLHRARVVLVDTRDRSGRRLLRSLAKGDTTADRLLVLAGSGQRGSSVRRLLRGLLRRGAQRITETQALSCLERLPQCFRLRLAFDDTLEVPTDFEFGSDSHSSGAAFLISRTNPFSGPVWNSLREQFSGPVLKPLRFQLRVRGAAVIMLQAGGRNVVARVVPPGPVQEIVRKNATLVQQLRGTLEGRPDLLRLMPEPIFRKHADAFEILAETCLSGTLAWQVTGREVERMIYAHAVNYLERLRGATLCRAGSVAAIVEPDLARVQAANFASPGVRAALTTMVCTAASSLEHVDLTAHVSHGDFGYGNILVDERTGELTGVIDWDTARICDLPGIDRVNLEIQLSRTSGQQAFDRAVEAVWRAKRAHSALEGDGGSQRIAALFKLGVCRYITRALNYPTVYREEEAGFERALTWLHRVDS